MNIAIEFAPHYRSAKNEACGAGRPTPPALLCTFLSASSHGSRPQMTFVSHQMPRGRCHGVYCHRDLLLENDQHHREEHIRKARHRRRQLNANACNHLQPSSHRSVRLASGYCLAICWISNLFDSNAKQTWGLCQTTPPATCPSSETYLGSFTCWSGWEMSATIEFYFLFQYLGVSRFSCD